MQTNPIMAEDLGNACAGLGDTDLSELREIARIYDEASGLIIKISGWVGDKADSVLKKIPETWKHGIDVAADLALRVSYATAATTQPDDDSNGLINRWLTKTKGEKWHKIASSISGAIGGAFGLFTTVGDLAATTTLAMRSIQQVATSYGEDITDEQVRLDCLAVFGFGGPLTDDDEVETGLYAVRMTLTGKTISELLKQVLPRFGVVVGEKLLTQATPILGAAAGATLNPVFVGYYQKMAHVHFRLRQLEKRNDPDQLRACLERIMQMRRSKTRR